MLMCALEATLAEHAKLNDHGAECESCKAGRYVLAEVQRLAEARLTWAFFNAFHAGRRRIGREIAAELADHVSDDALSAREIDVLRLIAGTPTSC
jgi:hypothetical protein